MKWDIDNSEKQKINNENIYACLNFECQDQFVGWVDGIVKTHLLLTALLCLACLLSI